MMKPLNRLRPGLIFPAKTRTHARVVSNPASRLRSPCPERIFPRRYISPAPTPPATEAPLIYVVDDLPDLTGLYTALLEAAGYRVRAFNDRADALAALKAARTKPDLLITDYLGRTMPVDRFLQRCLVMHPALRFLIVSGFRQLHVRVSGAKPEWFLQKPFTLDELKQEIQATLTE